MFDLTLIIQIFILLNPLASVPFLISAYKRKLNVKSVAVRSVLTAFVIAVLITLAGKALFGLFGITLDGLRIAGGVVLLLLGINMVRPKKEESEVGNIDSLIGLIATPMLTGPGTISFISIKSIELGKMYVLFNLFFAFILVGIVFILLSFFVDKINTRIVDISSRVLGLFLTAVAIEMVARGVEGMIAGVMAAK